MVIPCILLYIKNNKEESGFFHSPSGDMRDGPYVSKVCSWDPLAIVFHQVIQTNFCKVLAFQKQLA